MLNKIFRKAQLCALLPSLFLLSPAASAANLAPGSKLGTETIVKPAQLKVEFGSQEEIIRRLRRAGYNEIRVTKKGFSKVSVEACLNRDRYKVTVKRLGLRISRGEKIGVCRVPMSLDDVIAKLRKDGYSRISATEGRGGAYQIQACDRNRAVRLTLDRFGEIVRRKDLGKCRRGRDNFADIRLTLRDEGFNRIRLIERLRRGGYIVEACQRGRKFEITVNRKGRITRERRIGRCGSVIRPQDIPAILQKRGFDRIRITDARLPGYRAEACRRNTRMEVVLNRFGDIRNVNVLGDCEPPITRADLRKIVKGIGMNRINIKEVGARGFVVTGCLRLEKMEYHIDPYGDTFRRVVLGRCSPPPRLNEVIRDFRKNRKLDDVELYVEGCRRGKLLRFKLNRYGEVLDRQRAGRCR